MNFSELIENLKQTIFRFTDRKTFFFREIAVSLLIALIFFLDFVENVEYEQRGLREGFR